MHSFVNGYRLKHLDAYSSPINFAKYTIEKYCFVPFENVKLLYLDEENSIIIKAKHFNRLQGNSYIVQSATDYSLCAFVYEVKFL